MKKHIIPIYRHEQIGQFFKNTREDLSNLHIEIAKSKGGKRASIILSRIQQKITEAQSELEELMFKDHPVSASTNIYYGPSHLKCDPLNSDEFKKRLRAIGGNPESTWPKGKLPPF